MNCLHFEVMLPMVCKCTLYIFAAHKFPQFGETITIDTFPFSEEYYYNNFVSLFYCIDRILKLKWYKFINFIARSIRSIRLSWNQLNIEMLRLIYLISFEMQNTNRLNLNYEICLFAILFYCRYQLFISSGHPWWNICTT